MLDRKEIDKEIARLEWEESSYSNYSKLANLYTIRGQMEWHEDAPAMATMYSQTAAPYSVQPQELPEYGDSDFLRLVAGRDPYAVWEILDDLMDTLRAVNPRAYDSVVRKIRAV